MSTYAWIIDTDHLAEPGAEPGTLDGNAATVTGPGDAPDRLLAKLQDGDGIEFRLYDDDGELNYTGRLVPADLSDSDEGFGPLDDFGKPNAGCTYIQYKRAGEWETL